MLLPVIVAAVLASPPEQLAISGFEATNLPETVAELYSEQLAIRLRDQGLKVVTSSEVRALLGLERQRQLLGCADDASACLAEIANALGADAVVTGSIAKLEEAYRVTVQIYSSKGAGTLASFAGRASSEGKLDEVIDEAALRLADQLLGRKREAPTLSMKLARPSFWAPAAGGALVAGAGLFAFLSGQSRADALSRRDPSLDFSSPEEAQSWAAEAERRQQLGVVGMALGGAALAVATATLIFGAEDPSTAAGPAVSLALSPGGLLVRGSFE